MVAGLSRCPDASQGQDECATGEGTKSQGLARESQDTTDSISGAADLASREGDWVWGSRGSFRRVSNGANA